MDKILFLTCMFAGSAVVAATPTMTFPYGADMTVRHQTPSSVDVEGGYVVPAVDGGMPASDNVVTSVSEVDYMDAEPAESWDEVSAKVSSCQAALALRATDGDSCVWMGYAAGGWIELTGAAAHPGAWSMKIDCDYTLGADARRVRYSVREKDATGDYAVLSPAAGGSAWLSNGKADVGRVTKCRFDGIGELASATANSGRRPGYAETETVEDYRMDYSGVTLDVAIGATWGVDTLVATVKDDKGAVKGEVSASLSEAKDGKVRLDLGAYTKAGESYSCDLKLTGAYQDLPVVCDKGTSNIDLFSLIDWFGFDGSLVKATADAHLSVAEIIAPTEANVKGAVTPDTAEPDGMLTVLEFGLKVEGATMAENLPTPDSNAQSALAMSQCGGNIGRSWTVWSDADKSWVRVSGSGVGTGNAVYKVRAEIDGVAGSRKVRYSVRTDAGFAVLKKDGEEWFALPAGSARLNRLALLGTGGISSLNATYKATVPVGDVTVDDGAIVLESNAELDLAKTTLEAGRGYAIQTPADRRYHLRWKDAAGRYAISEGGVLTVKSGEPANGLESFASHVLGLDPTKAQDRPAAVVKPGGIQSADGVTVHVPNVVKDDLPNVGVEIRFQRQKSTDKGLNWIDDGDSVGVGESLKIPFDDGVLYRVNTLLK